MRCYTISQLYCPLTDTLLLLTSATRVGAPLPDDVMRPVDVTAPAVPDARYVFPKLLGTFLATIVNAYDGGAIDGALPRLMTALGEVGSSEHSGSGDGSGVADAAVLVARVEAVGAGLALANDVSVSVRELVPPEWVEEPVVQCIADVVGAVSGRLIPTAGFDERRCVPWFAVCVIVLL